MYRNEPQTRTHRATLAAVDWLEAAGEGIARKWPGLLAIVVLAVFLVLCAPRAHAAQDPDGGTVELVMPASRHAVWTGCAPAEVHMHDGLIDALVFCPSPPVWHIGSGTDALDVDADRIQSGTFEAQGFGSRNLRVTVVLSVSPEPGEPLWWQAQTCTLADLDTNSADDTLRAACQYLDNGE